MCNERDDDCDGQTDEGVTNPCGECGELPPEVCNERDDDCDGQVDEFLPENRCETGCGPEPPELCNTDDDDCDGAVDEGLPVNACGVCGEPPLELCNLEDDDCDGEVDEGHVHNLCGGCEPLAELCENDGEDEDCDGQVDEGFDVGASVDHCLGCHSPCSRNNAVPECLGGTCIIFRCQDVFINEDLDASNGCELRIPPVASVWVQAGADPDAADGTEDNPFPTIALGLDAALENARVFVLPGRYEEPVSIDTDGVQLLSQGRHLATIAGPVALTGNHTRLNGFEVDGTGQAAGVLLRCDSGCAAVGNRVIDVTPPEGSTTSADGIIVEPGVDIVVADNEITHVRGLIGPPFEPAPGTIPWGVKANGILVTGGRAVTVLRNSITRIIGGPTVANPTNHHVSGGSAVGIRVNAVDGATVVGNTVTELRGSGNELVAHGWGGWAMGLYFLEVANLTATGNTVDDLTAGRGADAREVPNLPGRTSGISLEEVRVATVSGNRVTRLRGGPGSLAQQHEGGRGGSSHGVTVRQSSDVRLTGNVFEEINGGLGPSLAGDGPAYALFVDAACRLTSITMATGSSSAAMPTASGVSGARSGTSTPRASSQRFARASRSASSPTSSTAPSRSSGSGGGPGSGASGGPPLGSARTSFFGATAR